jgi:cobalamin biosynthesis protein CobC
MVMARDHGGDLDRARGRWGGAGSGGDWIDLSTGINRLPWPHPAPVPALPAGAWRDLPTASARAAAEGAARALWGAPAALATNGAQAAIEALPHLWPPGRAAVLAPSYNEHAAQLRAAGWQVDQVADPESMAGADLAVIVNPNNPDGRSWTPAQVIALAGSVGRLVVDESFGDCDPGLSVAASASDRVIVLRSLGKFWGLAGVRLGFVLSGPATLDRLAARAGLWAVSGPALALGAMALPDRAWAEATRARLSRDAARLDGLAAGAGWRLAGGTGLFRTYDTLDAGAAQDALAQARIWSRIFPYSPGWVRLGLPGPQPEWDRLALALSSTPA